MAAISSRGMAVASSMYRTIKASGMDIAFPNMVCGGSSMPM